MPVSTERCAAAVRPLCDYVEGRAWGRATAFSWPRSVFDSAAPLRLSLFDLANTVYTHTYCGPESLLIGLVLMARYERFTGLPILPSNLHRLFATCVHVGLKLHSDFFFDNARFATIVGLQLSDLNNLEVELLRGLAWSVWVQSDALSTICTDLRALYDCPAVHATGDSNIGLVTLYGSHSIRLRLPASPIALLAADTGRSPYEGSPAKIAKPSLSPSSFASSSCPSDDCCLANGSHPLTDTDSWLPPAEDCEPPLLARPGEAIASHFH
jgi:hypothetical protein